MSVPPSHAASGRLAPALVTIAVIGAVIGGVGAPLITSVALELGVPLDAAQWTLTITMFVGAISAPVFGRLGTGPHRRTATLTALALVAAGGLLAMLPLPFWALLIGRALQGFGLSVAALLMSVARDYLPRAHAQSTIAIISVSTTVGIGVSYPLMGAIDQFFGPRVAYGVAFLVSLAAILVAWRVLPKDPPGPVARIDFVGALLLALAVIAVLLTIAQPALWKTPWLGAALLVFASVAFAAWVLWERRVPAPLVDVRLFGAGGMLRANAALLASGAGTYLLFSLFTRYVQLPMEAGFGFGLSGTMAGASLIPFSVLGFLTGRFAPRLMVRMPARWIFVIGAAGIALAAGVFVVLPDSLIVTLGAMSLLGAGVGAVNAVMPWLVLDGMPPGETASILSINQIVRNVAYSAGSALGGLLLAAATPIDALFPAEHGYTVAALCVLPLLALSVVIILLGPRAGSTTRAA